MTYRLHELASPEDWEAMHRLRLEVLFTPGRRPGLVYDRAHPHDTEPTHAKFLLLLDGTPIGTTRLDPRGDGGVVRLVGIARHLQGQGHGSAMEGLVVDYARARGMTRLWVNAINTAVGFYEKCGWTPLGWDDVAVGAQGDDIVQMTKPL
jgi:GNAT superfamily N-acetyltransferase